MQSFFDVLAVICLVLGVSLTVCVSVGWLTCSDYYFKIMKIGDGFPVFISTLMSFIFITMELTGYLITKDLFIPPLYFNMVLWIIIILCTVTVISFTYLLELRKYFAKKRGRRI